MKALVLGTGAREHAIVNALAADPAVDAVLAAPGNPGMSRVAECLPCDILDGGAVAALAREHEIDLIVVGPEAPLVAGVADVCREAGFLVVGPSAAAARLEGSKAFAKEVMAAAEVPTARSYVCTSLDEVENAIDGLGTPHVIKEDGLAAGKGVVVTDSRDEALEHARACLAREGGKVVVEEFLDGPEASVFCLSDGRNVVALQAAQDFKRIFEGDEGPNTGGMGAYSPLNWTPADLQTTVMERIAQPTIDEMARRGTPFVGILYVGLALTSRGPRVIEFNARLGDPDGQAVLARLRTPFGALMKATATGGLEDIALVWSEEASVVVVVASEGYPATPRVGDPIHGIEKAEALENVTVLHAGTAYGPDGGVITAGGRVLDVVATGVDLRRARESAYRAVDLIRLEGGQVRRDIAQRAAEGTIEVPGA